MDSLSVYWHPQIKRALKPVLLYMTCCLLQLFVPPSSPLYPFSCIIIILFAWLVNVTSLIIQPLRNTVEDGQAVKDPWMSLRLQIIVWNLLWPIWVVFSLPGTDVQLPPSITFISILLLQFCAFQLNSHLILSQIPYLPNQNDLVQKVQNQLRISENMCFRFTIGLSFIGLNGYFFFPNHQTDSRYFFLALFGPSLPTIFSIFYFSFTLSRFRSSNLIKRLIFLLRIDAIMISLMYFLAARQPTYPPDPTDHLVLLVHSFPYLLWNVFHQSLLIYFAAAVIEEYNLQEAHGLEWQSISDSQFIATEETRLLDTDSLDR